MSTTVLLSSHSQHQSSVSYVIPPSFTTSFLRQLRRHSSVSYDVILPQVTTSFLVHLRHHLHVSFVIYNVIPPPVTLAFLRWLWYHSSVSYRVIPPSVPIALVISFAGFRIWIKFIKANMPLIIVPLPFFDICAPLLPPFSCHVAPLHPFLSTSTETFDFKKGTFLGFELGTALKQVLRLNQ